MKPLIAKLADHDVDLIHPRARRPSWCSVQRRGGADQEWEEEIQGSPSHVGHDHIRALEALKVKRFIGASYFPGKINETFAKYFGCGFRRAGQEGIDVPQEVGNLSAELVYAPCEEDILKHRTQRRDLLLAPAGAVMGIIDLWSAIWRCR